MCCKYTWIKQIDFGSMTSGRSITGVEVGGEQKMLPAHVVNEYTRLDRSFDPCPQEWESPLPRMREMAIWSGTQSKYIMNSWFDERFSGDRVGSTFAFYRGSVAQYIRSTAGWGGGPESDLRALKSLWRTRQQQRESLICCLRKPGYGR
jgi:hypothetical protein